tara:strand:+ start:308 stop:574 length:267 start_codon:yes stop_codon:yes gene_type:complete
MEDFTPDPNNIPEFVLPDKLLEQIYEFSGTGDSAKGFLLAFVGQNGSPAIYTKTDTQIVEMGLRKAVEQYLEQSEQTDIDSSIGPVDE